MEILIVLTVLFAAAWIVAGVAYLYERDRRIETELHLELILKNFRDDLKNCPIIIANDEWFPPEETKKYKKYYGYVSYLD